MIHSQRRPLATGALCQQRKLQRRNQLGAQGAGAVRHRHHQSRLLLMIRPLTRPRSRTRQATTMKRAVRATRRIAMQRHKNLIPRACTQPSVASQQLCVCPCLRLHVTSKRIAFGGVRPAVWVINCMGRGQTVCISGTGTVTGAYYAPARITWTCGDAVSQDQMCHTRTRVRQHVLHQHGWRMCAVNPVDSACGAMTR